jgi:predicted acetyltransferase
MFRAVLEIDGRLDAYALYRVRSSWSEHGLPEASLEVIEAMATSPLATRELWSFLFGIDLVARVKAYRLPVDHPLPFMLAEPRRLHFALSDWLWLRVVDVRAALAARSYAGDDSVIFELADAFCPWNEGRWRLQAGSGAGQIETTSAPPDLRLDAGDLGAVYLGGVTFSCLARAGRVEELRQGAAERADALFRTERAPWCADFF